MNKRTWGTDRVETKLKYTYEKETDKYNNPITKKQMTKDELEEYLRGLELKCRWKNKKHF